MHAFYAFYLATNRLDGHRCLERCPLMLMPTQTFVRVHFLLHVVTFSIVVLLSPHRIYLTVAPFYQVYLSLK